MAPRPPPPDDAPAPREAEEPILAVVDAALTGCAPLVAEAAAALRVTFDAGQLTAGAPLLHALLRAVAAAAAADPAPADAAPLCLAFVWAVECGLVDVAAAVRCLAAPDLEDARRLCAAELLRPQLVADSGVAQRTRSQTFCTEREKTTCAYSPRCPFSRGPRSPRAECLVRAHAAVVLRQLARQRPDEVAAAFTTVAHAVALGAADDNAAGLRHLFALVAGVGALPLDRHAGGSVRSLFELLLAPWLHGGAAPAADTAAAAAAAAATTHDGRPDLEAALGALADRPAVAWLVALPRHYDQGHALDWLLRELPRLPPRGVGRALAVLDAYFDGPRTAGTVFIDYTSAAQLVKDVARHAGQLAAAGVAAQARARWVAAVALVRWAQQAAQALAERTPDHRVAVDYRAFVKAATAPLSEPGLADRHRVIAFLIGELTALLPHDRAQHLKVRLRCADGAFWTTTTMTRLNVTVDPAERNAPCGRPTWRP